MQQYREPKEDDAENAEIQINTYRGLGDVSLEGLACADGAGLFDSRRCLDGTRTDVLTEIVSWVYNTNEDVPRILWLNGQDGAGKSTIAHTIVRWFTDAGGLGACFCFARDRLVERREERIFTTIARDLAESDLAFRRALADAISKDPSLKTTYDVTLQWQRLILEPLSKVSGRVVGNVVVLIDDLDESGPDTSRSHILSLFTSAAAVHLPANLRILLTSRPLPDIEPVLRAVSHVKVISLDELLEESARDITFWVQQDLCRARDIGNTDIQMLVERANGAFEWARLACDYIKPNRPGQTAWERWEELMALESKGRRTLLDAVHEQVLDGIIPNDRLTVSRFQSVMKQVMSAKKPMTIDALNVQRKQFPNEEDLYDVGIIVEFMRTLLVGIHNRSSPVRLRHGSFYDCVTDPERSPTYFVCPPSELR
ncbi:hypothetical protein BKA82DRAFT_4047155 [Pisolithus tinctorius]|nr:hypothetical protein BKA82DRAFT_4047155 [Pisolithus tinctorius]